MIFGKASSAAGLQRLDPFSWINPIKCMKRPQIASKVCCPCQISVNFSTNIQNFMRNIMCFMVHPSKMQGEAKNCKKGPFIMFRVRLCTPRARIKIRQRQFVGIAILPTQSKFRQILCNFATQNLRATRTEAITLRVYSGWLC